MSKYIKYKGQLYKELDSSLFEFRASEWVTRLDKQAVEIGDKVREVEESLKTLKKIETTLHVASVFARKNDEKSTLKKYGEAVSLNKSLKDSLRIFTL